MPAVPSCILDPLREQFLAGLPPRHDDHPLGCHQPRIAEQADWTALLAVLRRMMV